MKISEQAIVKLKLQSAIKTNSVYQKQFIYIAPTKKETYEQYINFVQVNINSPLSSEHFTDEGILRIFMRNYEDEISLDTNLYIGMIMLDQIIVLKTLSKFLNEKLEYKKLLSPKEIEMIENH